MFTLVADATLFTSLLFGTFYLCISAPNWPPATAPEPNLLLVLASFVALAVAAPAARGSLRSGAAGGTPPSPPLPRPLPCTPASACSSCSAT
jgi:cytochrome c oxidase subunit I+III